MMFQTSAAWASAYPDAHVGVLAMREVVNLRHHPELEKQKATLEEQLRARWAGQDQRASSEHSRRAASACQEPAVTI